MFQILRNPQFDFMGRRNLWLTVSAVIIVLSVGVLFAKGIVRGVEFTGGTEIQLKFRDTPDLNAIRDALREAGIRNPWVTTIGDPGENEVYIRVGLEGDDEQSDLTDRVLEALRPDEVRDRRASGLVDLNEVDQARLEALLMSLPGMDEDRARNLAEALATTRRDMAVFHSWEEVAAIPGMTEELLQALKARTFLGPFALRSQSYIGPAIGRELMQKAQLAILGSLLGMLIYIWIRFEFQWGLAAVAALAHDTVITLGLFSWFEKEMSLPVVAAFLTLIGYSVNDTVVVFDRVRENLRLRGAGRTLPELINLSINQTLSRTVITSGLTWIVVAAIFFFGGEALNAFSFVLVAGVIVGTYSSIYVASPILVLWKQIGARLGRRKQAGRPSSGSRTKRSGRPRKPRKAGAGRSSS